MGSTGLLRVAGGLVVGMGLVAGLAAGLATSRAVAQQLGDGNGAVEQEPYRHISNGGLNHSLSAYVVTGQPFTAEQVGKVGRTLNDGTNIVHFGHHAIFRDSMGRVRVEQPCGCAPDHEQMVEVYVMDPVAGTLTRWRTGGDSPRVANVSPWKPKTPESVQAQAQKLESLRAQPQTQRVAAAASSRPQPQVSTEELPRQVMDGLPVRVVKVTTVVPAGRSGNDRPITKTHTAWISDDLGLVLMEQWEDPRDGMRTVGLAQFERKEPNAGLFQPPAGYTVAGPQGR